MTFAPGDYETWKYVAPIQKAAWDRKTFEFGTWSSIALGTLVGWSVLETIRARLRR